MATTKSDPQNIRLVTSRVEFCGHADGDLVPHPVAADRGAVLLEALKGFDDEFVALLEAGSASSSPCRIGNCCEVHAGHHHPYLPDEK